MKSLLITLVFLTGLNAQAATAGSSLYSTAALSGGAGATANSDKSIPNCSMAFSELSLDLGYKFSWVAPILQASYRYVGQTTDPDSVSNINMAGSGYTAGAGFALESTRLSFSAVYDFLGSYDLAKESSGGSKVTYTSASGFHVSVKYLWSGSWQLIASASQIKFKEKTAGSTKTDISSNPVTQDLYGIGIGYRF